MSTCEIQGAQHMISVKNLDFLVTWVQKLHVGARGHQALPEHSLTLCLQELNYSNCTVS